MTKQHLWRAIAFVVSSFILAAQARGAATLTRRPYLQAMGRNQITIMWRTATPAQQTIDYSTDLSFQNSAEEPAPTMRHELVITGLAPGATYHYRLREGSAILTPVDGCTFATDPGRQRDTFGFFVVGDIGVDDPLGNQKQTADMIHAMAPRADFGLLPGDIIYPKGEASHYDAQLMTPWADLLSDTPVVPCLGNHDWGVNPDSNFCQEWALPGNEHYFAFDYGNAHFIALDTADGYLYDEAQQLAWLESELARASGARWLFVYYHHPLLTCTYKGNMPLISAKLFPLFDRYHVDMVFNGHAHAFERLYPIFNGQPVDQAQNPNYTDPHGTIYVVSGAGARYKPDATIPCGPTASYLNNTVCFTQVYVAGNKLYILTFDSLTGEMKDAMTITKTSISAPSDASLAPGRVRLQQNVPNPFNPSTLIPFEMQRAGRVRLGIYRPDGTLVRQFAECLYAGGAHHVVWDGRDARGAAVASGAYVCRLMIDSTTQSIKMALVR